MHQRGASVSVTVYLSEVFILSHEIIYANTKVLTARVFSVLVALLWLK